MYFSRIAAAVKTDKEVLVLLSGNGSVKQVPVKGVADVGLGDAVSESGRLKDDIFIHRDSIVQARKIARRTSLACGAVIPPCV
jgi:hypothetical protein